MDEDIIVDKDTFDALLLWISKIKPISLEKVKAVPKIRKDGTPKRGKPKKNPA